MFMIERQLRTYIMEHTYVEETISTNKSVAILHVHNIVLYCIVIIFVMFSYSVFF